MDFFGGNAEELPFTNDTFANLKSFFQNLIEFFDWGGKDKFHSLGSANTDGGIPNVREAIAEGGNPNVEGLLEGPNFFDFGCHDILVLCSMVL